MSFFLFLLLSLIFLKIEAIKNITLSPGIFYKLEQLTCENHVSVDISIDLEETGTFDLFLVDEEFCDITNTSESICFSSSFSHTNIESLSVEDSGFVNYKGCYLIKTNTNYPVTAFYSIEVSCFPAPVWLIIILSLIISFFLVGLCYRCCQKSSHEEYNRMDLIGPV